VIHLEYAAQLVNIDSDEQAPRSLVERCHGAREITFAPDMLGRWPDGLEVTDCRMGLDAHPTLRVVVDMTTNRSLTSQEQSWVVAELRKLFESSWNYEFDLPDTVTDCQVHFETRPTVRPPDTTTPLIVELASEWPAVTFEQLAALDDAALDALLARLAVVAPAVRYDFKKSPSHAAVRALLEAATAQKQRRAGDAITRERADDPDFF
jgi:hypothetical protein